MKKISRNFPITKKGDRLIFLWAETGGKRFFSQYL